jgi:polyphosphate kinase
VCTLRPVGDIRIVSVLGRFLEHSRFFHFGNAGSPEYFIGSADWRPRNLRRRVEVITPVVAAPARVRLDRILALELTDPGAWQLHSDGSYTRDVRARQAPGSQERLVSDIAR